MAIYTKTGDTGKTAIFGGKRVWKYDPRVEAYGSVDEASASLGLVYESITEITTKKLITQIQWDLYAIMAYLSGAEFKRNDVEKRIPLIESEIDTLEHTLPKLTRFILPQGSEQTVRFHFARTVVRTAERRIVAFIEEKGTPTADDEVIMKYINRLSDLLFMFARTYSHEEKQA